MARALRRAALITSICLLALPTGVAAQPSSPPLVEDPTCFGLAGGPALTAVEEIREVTCGRLEVPLFHGDPPAGSASLAVAVLRAVAEPTGPPIIILTGGPGEPAIPAGLGVFGLGGEIALGPEGLTRDVVLLDQRGTGYSTPNLDCPELGAVQPAGVPGALGLHVDPGARFAQGPAEPQALLEQVAACKDRLDPQVELNAYGTIEIAQDVELLRRALGQGQAVLYGTSYGTELALEAAELFPESWAALVLSSPIPGDANFMAELPTTYDEALDALEAGCEADPTCPYADVVARASERIRALADQPVQVTVPDPTTGAPLTAPLTPNGVATSLYQLQYADARPLPALLDGLADAQDRGLAFALGTRADGPVLVGAPPTTPPGDGPLPAAFGMQLSNLCREEIAAIDEEAYAARLEAATPLAAAFGVAPFGGALTPRVCEIWGVVPSTPDPVPVTVDVPALVVGGALDHITPASYAERVAADLPDAELLIVPDGVHAPLLGLGACGGAILSAFVADPTARPDTTCATERDARFDAILPDAPTLGAERLSGPDRFATAAAASRYSHPDGADLVVVASGEDFPDALVGGAAAGAAGAPLLLTGADELPEVTAGELDRLDPEEVVLLGGPEAVAEDVATAVGDAAGAEVVRIAGESRAETAALVAAASVETADGVWLATGDDHPDALAAGAAAGALAQPVLLVDGNGVPPATAAALQALAPGTITAVGGQVAIPDAVLADAAAAAGTDPEVVRLAGPDRYATAAAVAAATPVVPTSRLAAVAVTGDGFADALAAGPLAAGRAPLVLVPATGPTAPLEAALADRVGVVAAVGGPIALPDAAVVGLVGVLPPLLGGGAPAQPDPGQG